MNEITALAFAAEAHKHQTRKLCEQDRGAAYDELNDFEAVEYQPHGGAYINHPIRMYERLTEMGAPTVCRMAALLHDTVEDTDVTEEDLYAKFPEEVVHVVMELTDDKTKPKANRKELQVQKASTLTPEAKIVKMVDLWDNCSGLILQNQTWPWDEERVAKYVAWAYQLHDEMIAGPDLEPQYAEWLSNAGNELIKVLKQYEIE